MSTHWVDKLVFCLILDVNQKVWRGRIVGLLLEYFLTVPNLGDIAIIIFTPDTLCEVVNVNPIVAKADGTAVNEDGLKAIGKITKVGELATDICGEILDLSLYVCRIIDISHSLETPSYDARNKAVTHR